MALVVLCAVAAGGGAPGGASTAGSEGVTVPRALGSTDSILGVFDASGGSFDGKRLTLTGVEPRFTWFSDRPARRAGLLGVGRLDETFFRRQAPPNAAVVFEGLPASRGVVVAELSKPHYDSAQGRLTFVAKIVQPDDVFAVVHPRIAELARRARADIPKRFGAVTVFVDTAPSGTETPDQVEVGRMSEQYVQLENAWAEALQGLENCWDSTKDMIWYDELQSAKGQFQPFISFENDVNALQRAVADGGTLTSEQKQQVSQIEATFPASQTETNEILTTVRENSCSS